MKRYIVTSIDGTDLGWFKTLRAARAMCEAHPRHRGRIEVHAFDRGLLYVWLYNPETGKYRKASK